MKKIFTIVSLILGFLNASAKHITGGEIIYDYISSTPNSKTYRITLILFRDENCINPCAEMPPNVYIGVFNNDNNQLFGGSAAFGGAIEVNRNSLQNLPLNAVPICITNPPSLNYNAGFYSFTIELPNNSNGYTAAYQTCCRIENTNNINNMSDGAGATYTTSIPGLNRLGATIPDSSPRFSKGISVVCRNNDFILDFSATDPDGDVLVYSMCSAYNGGGATNAGNRPPDPPPYGSVNYVNGFTSFSPLGPLASMNTQTGIISGIAPEEGKYVVSVCVSSYRNGNLIAVHRKDFIITVAPCDFASADLLPEYITCDGFSFQFINRSQSPLNETFYWEFGEPSSGTRDTSTAEIGSHTYADTGIYTVKFVVNRGTPCADSTTTKLKVYPGYFPAADNISPICKGIAVQFSDLTTATYGTVNNWSWDFGIEGTDIDVSTVKNPTYIYTVPGDYTATLIVGSSKGCIDTVTTLVKIVEKPEFIVTNDTLICSVDSLQLSSFAPAGGGSVAWSPNYNINNTTIFNPIVWPKTDTTYKVTYTDNFGCIATDEVVVMVVDSVTLSAARDTSICRTDQVRLRLNSNGLKYIWTPSATLDDGTVKNPLAIPVDSITMYRVQANIGSCVDFDSIEVRTHPYPQANAGPDQTICFGASANLQASGGSFYSWSPAIFLNNTQIANPVSTFPFVDSINYAVTVRDTMGCPKPVTDSMKLTIIRIIADAGPRDTAVVLGQPLQLTATGSDRFLWTSTSPPETPPNWLSNPNIFNPVVLAQDDIEYVVTASNSIGCADTDTILVKLYKLAADIYVPTAFSPNGDGTNDVLKPLALGLLSIDAFRIYNRWGQLLFTTSQIGEGWNGMFKGSDQSTGTYVWYAEGRNYKNQRFQKKGYVVLIR